MNPKQFGRYEIQAEVGRGGMAVVYKAFDPQLGRTVALKVLPAQFMHDPSFLDRFQREAHTIAQLEHYAIVPLYDYGEHEGQPFLVMRYMSGGTLADRLRDGPLSIHQSLQIMERICAALDKAHLNGIVHRDLKPGNILFDDEASAYLSDFGIVRLSGQTHTHTVIGTPQYMAPEQAHGQPVDSRTDVYQMGVVLFNMLSGRVPFNADTLPALLHMHAYEPVPSILEFAPQLPSSIDIVIRRAMAKDKAARYQSTLSLASALRDVVEGKKLPEEVTTLAGAGMSGFPPTMVGGGNDVRGAGRRWPLFAGLLLLVLVAGGALLASLLQNNGGNVAQATLDAIRTQEAVALVATMTPSPSASPTTTETATATATGTPTSTHTPTQEPTQTTTPSMTPEPRLRILGVSALTYSGPGVGYNLLRSIVGGDTVRVLGITEDRLWYNVELNDGTHAWLAAEVVEPTNGGGLDNVAVVATVPPLPPADPSSNAPTFTPTLGAVSGSDRDGDGILDSADACPDEWGVAEANGCTVGRGGTRSPTSTPTPVPPPLPTDTPTAYP